MAPTSPRRRCTRRGRAGLRLTMRRKPRRRSWRGVLQGGFGSRSVSASLWDVRGILNWRRMGAAHHPDRGLHMFERLERSYELAKASAAVLRQDKELVLFPLFSAASLVAVMVAFILPAIGLNSLDSVHMYDQAGKTSPLWYIFGFFFYLANYLVIFYFNTALVAAAMIRMDGGTPTLKEGLRVANSKIGTIFVYALISATV